jgi:hypothetical protein
MEELQKATFRRLSLIDPDLHSQSDNEERGKHCAKDMNPLL